MKVKKFLYYRHFHHREGFAKSNVAVITAQLKAIEVKRRGERWVSSGGWGVWEGKGGIRTLERKEW